MKSTYRGKIALICFNLTQETQKLLSEFEVGNQNHLIQLKAAIKWFEIQTKEEDIGVTNFDFRSGLKFHQKRIRFSPLGKKEFALIAKLVKQGFFIVFVADRPEALEVLRKQTQNATIFVLTRNTTLDVVWPEQIFNPKDSDCGTDIFLALFQITKDFRQQKANPIQI